MSRQHGTRSRYIIGCRCDDCCAANREYKTEASSRARSTAPPESAHGTVTGYNYWGCRCDECRDAAREHKRVSRARRYDRLGITPRTKKQIAEHGTRSKYTTGCRCEDCRSANAAYHRDRYEPQPRRAIEHGETAMYRRGCRCDACKAAERDYRLRLLSRPIPEHVHGTYNGYTNWRCRCDRCRAAGAEANKVCRERRLDRASGGAA